MLERRVRLLDGSGDDWDAALAGVASLGSNDNRRDSWSLGLIIVINGDGDDVLLILSVGHVNNDNVISVIRNSNRIQLITVTTESQS